MTKGALLSRLFSRTTMVFLFIVVLLLLGASFYTFIQDRKLQSVSVSALRMASWNLAQLGNEASAFDRELTLGANSIGDPDEISLRYDVLWSRYVYLLSSQESYPIRSHADNKEKLEQLFRALKDLEAPLMTLLEEPGDWNNVLEQWELQKSSIQQLVIDNFVGDETSRMVADVEASRDRLANLRILTLIALAAVFSYLALGLAFLRRQSRIDSVTGLPNSNYLRSIRYIGTDKTIVICEIREFQLVLSDFGNEGGNSLARTFVDRLQGALLPDDELIQTSQNEFLIILSARENTPLEATVHALVSTTTFDWRQEGSILHISAILGVDPESDSQSQDWNIRYQQAHRALTQAHLEGESVFINGDDLRRRIEEERQIHTGLLNFFSSEPGPLRLEVVYQPIVKAHSRHHITGSEVLLRCKDNNIGFVPPNRVVDICERFGLGVELGQWLFRKVTSELYQVYQDLGFRGIISINLNPAMIRDELVDDVQRLLVNRGIPASALCLEITEDNAALDFDRINNLIGQLHHLGLTFALDDFGTGHSSLEYVRELKVDRLKIDRCFVDGIEFCEDKARFLGSIIAMAEQAYMKSVIEGVENEAQWQLVQSMGGVLIQGYHAHKPMPLSEYMTLILSADTRNQSTSEDPFDLRHH